MADVKNNLRASAEPQLTDDEEAGYVVGSLWVFNSQFWRCAGNEAGAAVWRRLYGAPRGWPSGQRLLPANMAAVSNGAIGTTADKLIFLPFEIDREVNISAALVYVAATTAGGASADLGLYANDPLTDKPGARLARAFGADIASATGTRQLTFASPVTVGPGLYWGAIGIKGVATPANVTRLTGSTGKHLGGGTLNDLGGAQPWRCYAGSYTFANGLPATAPTISQDNTNDAVLMAFLRT